MFNFRQVSLSDRELINKYVSKVNFGTTETAFLDLFIWAGNYNTCIAEDDGILYGRVGKEGEFAYLFPIGDLQRAINTLLDIEGDSLRFVGVTDEARVKIENTFPDKFEFIEQRDNFDYVYLSESLINLPGRKLHSKRTNINKFLAYTDDFSFEEINEGNMDEVLKFQKKWFSDNLESHGESLNAENCAILRAFRHFDELGIRGGLLRVNGEVSAYSLGTPINSEYYLISVEKGNTEIPGIYQMINKMYAEHFCKNYKYINREEDMGNEGLRSAKLSYRPEFLIKKYEVLVK